MSTPSSNRPALSGTFLRARRKPLCRDRKRIPGLANRGGRNRIEGQSHERLRLEWEYVGDALATTRSRFSSLTWHTATLKASMPFRTKYFGQVPPRLLTVFKSCTTRTAGSVATFADLSATPAQAYRHICAANQGIRDLGVERRDPDELHGPESPLRRLCEQSRHVIPGSETVTHEEKLDPTVHATTRRKYQVPMSPAGKRAMSNIETAAQPNRVHMAMSHCVYRDHQSQPTDTHNT